MNEGNIRRFSAAELRERRARGESRSDLARVRAQSEEEVERAATQQLEEDGIEPDWVRRAEAVKVDAKKLLSLRLDNDVVEWFRSQGPGYQTRINAVLKEYVKHATSRQS